MRFHSGYPLQVAVVMLSLLLPWPHPVHQSFHCPRERSFIVRRLVSEKWLPIFAKYRAEMPLDCPLHEARDVYQPLHQARAVLGTGRWGCRLCGKAFVSQDYLDLHLSRKHLNRLVVAEDTTCPADFCDVARCDVLQAAKMLGSGGVATEPALGTALARPTTALVATGHDWTCRQRDYEPVDGNRRWLAVAPLPSETAGTGSGRTEGVCSRRENASDAPASSSSSSSSSSDGGRHAPLLAALRQQQAACRDHQLVPLQLKCARLVDSCTAGLLLHMTNQQFSHMQSELNRALCWHLNCSTYWHEIWPSGRDAALSWTSAVPLLAAGAFCSALAVSYCIACVLCEEASPGCDSPPVTRPASATAALVEVVEAAPFGDDQSWAVDQHTYDECLQSSLSKLADFAVEEESSVV